MRFSRKRRKLALERIPVTYVCEGWFLQDLIHALTSGPDEDIAYVTGVDFGKLRMLSRICRVKLAEKSPVYALGEAGSCADVLIEILEHGNHLHCMAHSHPGCGPLSTCPSSTDLRYLKSVQKAGAEVIGVIVTRDGCARFFSVQQPFRVLVFGQGVTQLDQNVFHVSPP